MVLGKRWLFLIGNVAEIRPLEKGRKSPDLSHDIVCGSDITPCIKIDKLLVVYIHVFSNIML